MYEDFWTFFSNQNSTELNNPTVIASNHFQRKKCFHAFGVSVRIKLFSQMDFYDSFLAIQLEFYERRSVGFLPRFL